MTPLTLLVKGLLKNRLVKAAEGGTEIFKFREQELLIPVGHVVLGLRRLLEAHRLGDRLWVVGHLDNLGEKKQKKPVRYFMQIDDFSVNVSRKYDKQGCN